MLTSAVPTVMMIDGLRVVIYPNDHRPAHVHVIGAGCEAVFELVAGHSALRENYGFRGPALARVKIALEQAYDDLIDSWNGIHDADI